MEHGECSNSRSIAPEVIRVDHVWHVVIRQEPVQEGLCRLLIPPILQEKIHILA